MANPFSTQFPSKPENFADRKEKIEKFKRSLKNSLESGLPENIAILGDWGIGKTSMLNKFKDIVLSSEESKFNIFCTKICLSPSNCKDEETFSKQVIEDIVKNSETLKKSTMRGIRENLSKIKSVQISAIGGITFRDGVKSKRLLSFLTEFWEKNLAPNKIDLAVIMVDDLHYMLGNYREGLYDIRSIFQELAERRCNYMLIVTSPLELFELKETAEPFKRFFEIMTLGPFDLKGTKEAALKPISNEKIDLKIADNVISEIHKLTEGHPYFVVFFMKDIMDTGMTRNFDRGHFNNILNSIMKHLGGIKFRSDFNSASEEEKKLLIKFANSKKEVLRAVDMSRTKPPNVMLSRLIKKNLLNKVERGKFKLYHPLFKKYLKSL